MDQEIEDYLLIISEDERNLYEKLLKHEKIIDAVITKDFEKYLLKQVIAVPYPTLQILKPLMRKSKIIQHIIYEAFHKFTEDDFTSAERKAKFFNFLCNFELPAHYHMQIIEFILPKIYEKREKLSENLYFSLLARLDDVGGSGGEDDKLLRNYIELEGRMAPVFSKKSFLYKVIQENEHPIFNLIREDCLPNIENEFFRNVLCILKLVNYMNCSSPILEDFIKLNRIFAEFSVEHMNNAQKMLYAELYWTYNNLKFVRKYSNSLIDLPSLLQETNALEILYKYTPILHIGYDECKQFLENNFQLLSIIYGPNRKCEEIEILSYFFILVNIFDIIVCRHKMSEIIEEKLSAIQGMFRCIKNIDTMNNLIEDIFRLFFLRWEQFNCCLTKSQEYRTNSSGASIGAAATATTGTCGGGGDNLDTCTTTVPGLLERYGFICREKALKEILRFFKSLIAKRYHTDEYKTAATELQEKFGKLSTKITAALWKLNLIEKNSFSDADDFQLQSDDIIPLIKSHFQSWERNNSSDDEQIRGRTYSNASRRKVKLKKRNSLISAAHSSKEKSKEDNTKTKVSSAKEDKHIITKMLGPTENLVILLLNAGNLTVAKKLIQIFKLQNTEYEKALIFLENMQNIKRKLHMIYEKYKEEEMQNSTNPSTIQRIKKAAAIGFEVAKITNIVEKFVYANLIQPTEDTQKLIEKYCNNYPFLQQYLGNSLQITTILDLVLNSSFDYEISFNILTLIERSFGKTNSNNVNISTGGITNSNQQQQPISIVESLIDNDNNTSTQQSTTTTTTTFLDSDIGCLTFFKNVVECMHLLKISEKDVNVTIKSVLLNNCYPLKANKLAETLKKEEIFYKLFAKTPSEIATLKDLKALLNNFEEFNSPVNYFQRLYMYLMNLSKLLHLRDKNLDLPITEMIKLDPRIIIGDLVFEDNMTPMELENIIAGLNLNFLHIIALNICPDISNQFELHLNKREINDNNKSILNYIEGQNLLLGYLLKQINGIEVMDQQEGNKDTTAGIAIMTKYFSRVVELPEIHYISKMFGNNLTVAALMEDSIDVKALSLIRDKIDLILIANSIIEQTKNADAIHQLRNKTISEAFMSGDKIHFIELVSDVNLRAKLIIENFTKIHDANLAERLINSTLLHRDIEKLPNDIKVQLNNTLQEIQIYTDIALIYNFRTWTQAYDFSLISPGLIMETLLKIQNYALCYEWSKITNLPEKFITKKKTFFTIFLTNLIEMTNDVERNFLDLIESFPLEDVLQFYDKNLEKFRSLPLLEYIIDLLAENNDHLKLIYGNYKISLKIFEQMSETEREMNWNFLSKPLLLIEQFIMNTKFETLSTVLAATRSMFYTIPCKYCSNKQTDVYSILSKTTNSYSFGTEGASGFLLLNFNLYQKDHIITGDCVNLLLEIYASKALDYQISEIYSSSEKVSQSTDLASLDSLCGIFIMPKEAPKKENWIKDEEATFCMCCRRAVFTMLIRRHHCRRCGRVICSSCSSNRLKIPELYEDVLVRVCNDCYNQTQALESKINKAKSTTPEQQQTQQQEKHIRSNLKWLLSGNLTHDKLLRDEFCYEHTPSVALCLSILSHHTNDREYVKLLLYHCRKLEKLLRPNPEVDITLVAKMLICLAVAAKMRGGTPECDTIRDHSEIIMSVVQNGCESLLPMEPLTNHSLRKLGDALVSVEKWSLALNVFLKCGFPTTGVKAAHGLLCLRAGCFDTAREKLSHCLTRLCDEEECLLIKNIITTDPDTTEGNRELKAPIIKRPNRSQPLLQEIITIIESTSNIPCAAETIKRASIIRSSNTSLASKPSSRRKENIPIHEPALNILNTLANLKEITKGNYTNSTSMDAGIDNRVFIKRQSKMFEECFYYILSYGSHADVINFLIRNDEMLWALKYFLLQNINIDIFTQNIYLKYLKIGRVNELIKEMKDMDNSFLIWKEAIIHTCRYLETKNLLNCLYQLQLLLKDPIRASMTCVKFYSMNCASFRELQMNSFHLLNAKKHLESELEYYFEWEDINIERKREQQQQHVESSILMQMDPKNLINHINTIGRQLEVVKFLSKYEENSTVSDILKQIRLDSSGVPTLFDSIHDKIQICILILLSGRNIEEGFGLAFGIIQDYKLSPIKVYGGTAKCLSKTNRLKEVENLIKCINSNNGKDTKQIDEILSISIYSAININEPEIKTVLDNLIKKIENIDMKISCYIYIGQLKAAYLIAIQYNKINDIKKILRHAETTNQIHIKKLCEKKLNIK